MKACTDAVTQHLRHMALPLEVREKLEHVCLAGLGQAKPSTALTTLFNILYLQGKHGHDDPSGWRHLTALIIVYALTRGHDLTSVWQAYQNATVHNKIMGYGFYLGHPLIWVQGQQLYLADDVHLLT